MPSQNSLYYLTEVDKKPGNIYCMHDLMGENDIRSHRHDKGQFLYTEGGVVHVRTEQKTFFLPARHYMWIAPGVVHSIHSGSEAVMMRNLYFPVEKGEPSFYSRTAIYPVNDLLLQMIWFSNRWNGDIDGGDKGSYRFALALKSILPEVSFSYLPLALPYAKDPRLKKVIAFMGDHLGEQVVFPDLARRFGFSERSLSRLFHDDVGISFVQYLTFQRIAQALELLLEDKLSVKEVASSVGYHSVPSFSTTFTRIVGVRPSEYVKMKGVLGEPAI